MAILLRRLNEKITVHGFRSTFRDWAAETTGFSHELCEMALTHAISNKTEAAYRRGDLFKKRSRLMEAWALCHPRVSVPVQGELCWKKMRSKVLVRSR